MNLLFNAYSEISSRSASSSASGLPDCLQSPEPCIGLCDSKNSL